jgi:hypothetical protein
MPSVSGQNFSFPAKNGVQSLGCATKIISGVCRAQNADLLSHTVSGPPETNYDEYCKNKYSHTTRKTDYHNKILTYNKK